MKHRLHRVIQSLWSHSLARNGSIMFAGTMVVNILSYAYHLIVGRILGPEQYGTLATILSLLYILNVPSEVMRTVLVKYFSTFKARDEQGQMKRLLVWVMKRLGLAGVGGIILVIPLIPWFSSFLNISEGWYFVWLYIIFVSAFYTTVNLSALLGMQHFTASVVFGSVTAFLRVAIGAAGAWFGVGWALVANMVSNILGYVISFVPLRDLLGVESASSFSFTRKSAVAYSIPVFVSTFGMMIIFSQDVVWVKHFFSSFDAGIYSSLSVLGKVIFFATNSIGLVLLPTIAEAVELKKNTDAIVYPALAVVAAITGAICAVYFMFPHMVVTLLFGNQYLSAVQYVGIFGLYLSFFSLASVIMNICLSAGMTKAWILTMTAAIVQVVGINMFHADLTAVIRVNMVVSAMLMCSLLVYYHYAKRLS